MLIKTASLIADPCDEEYDNMALLCCHSDSGELFSLSRFPDEKEIEMTVGDDKTLTVSQLKVTFSAERLLVELEAEDAMRLDGHAEYEIVHATAADDLSDVEATLRIILEGVGTYVGEVE